MIDLPFRVGVKARPLCWVKMQHLEQMLHPRRGRDTEQSLAATATIVVGLATKIKTAGKKVAERLIRHSRGGDHVERKLKMTKPK